LLEEFRHDAHRLDSLLTNKGWNGTAQKTFAENPKLNKINEKFQDYCDAVQQFNKSFQQI